MYFESIKVIPKSPSGEAEAIEIGRVSTPHQDMASIEAGYRENGKVIETVCPGPVKIYRFADRASGWKVQRQSMKAVEKLIRSGRIDLIVMQDLGRAYRNPEYQFRLAHLCKDHRTRLICPGDGIDTEDPNWEVTLHTAALRHGITVPETRRRVRTKATYEFHRGGMVLKILAFYKKVSAEEAAANGGSRIARLPEYDSIVREMWTRIVLLGQTGERVARWLRKRQVPTGPYVKKGWSGKLVREFLRSPVLYGLRTFRKVQHQIIYETGDHRREPNPNPETKLIPELAFVTYEEWTELQGALDLLGRPRKRPGKGRKNVARRESYFPGQHIICSCCNGMLYWTGGDLKCQNAYSGRPQTCWNRLLVDGELLRQRLLPKLLDEVRKRPVLLQSLVDSVWTTFDGAINEQSADEMFRELEIENLQTIIRRTAKLVIKLEGSPSLEAELRAAEAKLRVLRAKSVPSKMIATDTRFLSRDDVAKNLDEALLHLSRTSYDLGALLRETFPDLRLVPIAAIGSEQIRPRIKWKLPADPENGYPEVELVLDAFEYSIPIRYAMECERLKREHPDWSLNRIGQEVGISKKSAADALKYAAVLSKHGIDDPFVEVTERPEKASRWRRPSDLEDSDSDSSDSDAAA